MRIDLPDDWEDRIGRSSYAPSPMEQTAIFTKTVQDMIRSWRDNSAVPSPLDIVFTQPPGPEGECVFVDVEHAGVSTHVGYWFARDGSSVLRIPRGGIEP